MTFCDQIQPADLLDELIMTGLRMDRGIQVTPDMRRRYGSRSQELIRLGLLSDLDGYWAATERGRVILDSVVLQLVSG